MSRSAALPSASGPDADPHHAVDVPWTKSTFSGTGNCVEVAVTAQQVMVRDSKNPQGPVLTFTPAEWDCFLVGVHRGQFTRGKLRTRTRAWARRTRPLLPSAG